MIPVEEYNESNNHGVFSIWGRGWGCVWRGGEDKRKRHLLSESGIYEKQEVPFLKKFLF